MAYIQRRQLNGKVRFIVRWPKADGPGNEHSRSFTKERPAIRFQHQVEHDIDHGGHQDERAGHVTLTAYAERWLARRVVSVGTLKNVEQDLRNFILPAMGSKRLNAITVATTQEFLASLARKTKANGQPYAESYLRRIYSTFVSLLHAALDDGLITRLPLPRTSGLHPVLSEAVVLVPWQVDALVQAVEELNPRFAALTAFLFASGCRIGEAVALRHEDFTWPRRVVRIRRNAAEISGKMIIKPYTKNRRARTLTLDEGIMGILGRHCVTFGLSDDGYLFGGANGAMVRPGNYRDRVFYPAAKRAGLDPRPSPHDARHTRITSLLLAGVPVATVAEMAGDTQAVIIKHYSHVMRHGQDQALEDLARWQAAQPVPGSGRDDVGPATGHGSLHRL